MRCHKFGCILVMPRFKVGDPAPSGYLEWHEWADVQAKAGLKQLFCGQCSGGKWVFPFECGHPGRLTVREWEAENRRIARQVAREDVARAKRNLRNLR